MPRRPSRSEQKFGETSENGEKLMVNQFILGETSPLDTQF